MKRRKKPLKRSTKPLKRTPLKRSTKPIKRKKRPNRERKTPIGRLKKEITRLHSLYIRKRDGKCVQCGSTEDLTCGHVLPGRKLSTKWDIGPKGNAHCQCWPCNRKHVFEPQHYISWYIRTFGFDAFEELKRRDAVIYRWPAHELRELHRVLMQLVGEE